jgi:multiple sugar transport system permease protein
VRGSRRFAWTLATPGLIGLVAISVVPFFFMVKAAFQRFHPNPRVAPEWVGLDNLWGLIEDPQFLQSIQTTLVILVVCLFLQLTLGFALAWALYHIRRGRAFVISLLLIPTAIAPIIAGIVWWMLFNTQYGAINSLIGKVGIDPVQWTVTMPAALIAIIVATVWQTVPFVAIILLGGLTTIPPDILDASRVDGASRFRALRYIVFPLLRPFFGVASLFMFIDLLRLFEMPQYLTTGGPGNDTVVMGMYLYKLGFSFFDLGRASMMSLLYVIVLSVVAALFVRLMQSRRAEG